MANTALNKSQKSFLFIGFILLALAVILGAFGAHMVEPRLSPKYFATYKTANLYHYIHSIGIVIATLSLSLINSPKVKLINILFYLGLICFSASLYVLSFNELLEAPGLKILGAVAPIGGTAFIIAWILTALEFRKA